MQTHAHPKTGVQIHGTLLAAGAILVEDDQYDSTRGSWEECPIPGLTLGPTDTIWVRSRDLSDNAKELLKFLTRYPCGIYSHVRENGLGSYVVVPDREWNAFTATFNWATPNVMHPRCVQELIDVGFLSPEAPVHSVTDLSRTRATQLDLPIARN